MDEAPGVADRELILSGMLVCSTASGQDVQRIIVEERLVVPSQIFRRRSSRTTIDRGEAERFRLLPRSTNGNAIRPRPAHAGGRVQALSSIDRRRFFNARRDAGAPFSRVASAGRIGRRPVAGIAWSNGANLSKQFDER